jgi:hypothetical protein
MRRILFCHALILASIAYAQDRDAGPRTFASPRHCRQTCDDVMALIAKGSLGDAFRMLSPYWVFHGAEFTEYQVKTIKRMPSFAPRFGKSIGAVFAREEIVADTVLRLTYVQKFERHALRWTFLFYRPADRWLLNRFAWDENLQQLFVH